MITIYFQQDIPVSSELENSSNFYVFPELTFDYIPRTPQETQEFINFLVFSKYLDTSFETLEMITMSSVVVYTIQTLTLHDYLNHEEVRVRVEGKEFLLNEYAEIQGGLDMGDGHLFDMISEMAKLKIQNRKNNQV